MGVADGKRWMEVGRWKKVNESGQMAGEVMGRGK